MKQYFNALLTAGCLAVAMLGASCKKEIQPASATEIAGPKNDLQIRKCDIARIIVPNYTGTNTITFEYNKKGDPVSVTPSVIDSQSPKLLFRYDKRGNLTDYIIMYDTYTFYYWYKFDHNKQGQVIADTLYYSGTYGEEPTDVFLTYYAHYEYDELGRLVKINPVLTSPARPIGVNTFEYDANGNLVRSNSAYDSQVNILRTSEVWMFIFHNYSRNNLIAATAYNSLGLPLSFNTNPGPYYFFGGLGGYWQLNHATIEYNCKGNVN